MLLALNFTSERHEQLLKARKKDYTVRLGDISNVYIENSVVWITVGPKYGTKQKLYSAFVDRVKVKKISELTKEDLSHQNPDIESIDELILFLEEVYKKTIYPDDLVTVISFTEIIE